MDKNAIKKYAVWARRELINRVSQKALIYMHRNQPDTIARIRTDYVHEQQSRYRTAIADLQQRMGGASTGDRVKVNYARFADVLAKIK